MEISAMRVIAGIARGHKLETPKGAHVRPTLDRVREALFNILTPRVEGARFLDLFAGTGANGIEALSRGALSCIFVDNDTRSIEMTRRNLEKTGLDTNAKVLRLTLPAAMDRLAGEGPGFDIIYADPPHKFNRFNDLLDGVAAEDLLATGGLVIVEHASRNELEDEMGGIALQRSERYGEATLSFFG